MSRTVLITPTFPVAVRAAHDEHTPYALLDRSDMVSSSQNFNYADGIHRKYARSREDFTVLRH